MCVNKRSVCWSPITSLERKPIAMPSTISKKRTASEERCGLRDENGAGDIKRDKSGEENADGKEVGSNDDGS